MLNLDRIAGCLVGGALGDAIGGAFENQKSPRFGIPRDLRISDDTQLTMATCESIIEQSCVEPAAIAERMAAWYRERRISGIGGSTLKALTELAAGGHWAMVGATGERSAGNGAAMRIAPLAFVLDPNDDLDRRTIRDVARITHRNDEAYLGALSMVYAIRERTLDRSLLATLIAKLPDSQMRDRFVEIENLGLAPRSLAEKFPPTGFVVDSVPFAVLAAIQSNDLMDSIQMIVECGGDTDTTCSMYGNLFGAMHGVGSIPSDIAESIDEYDALFELAQALSHVVNAR